MSRARTYEHRTLLDRIGTGNRNAIYISNDRTDLREIIADANRHGDCIINVRGGYYRPRKDVPEEAAELQRYLNREFHRAKEIMDKADAMREAFYGRY